MKVARLPLICVLGAISGVAFAEEAIYRWTDADGTVHYSNEPQRVPEQRGAEVTRGEEIGLLPTDPKQPVAAPTRDQLEERKLTAELRRAEAEAQRAELEAKHLQQRTDEEWRAAFRDARARIARLQAELEEERALLEINGLPVVGRTVIVARPITPAGVVIDDRYERAKVRVPQLERAILEAQRALEDLERRASFAAVPRHLRQ